MVEERADPLTGPEVVADRLVRRDAPDHALVPARAQMMQMAR